MKRIESNQPWRRLWRILLIVVSLFFLSCAGILLQYVPALWTMKEERSFGTYLLGMATGMFLFAAYLFGILFWAAPRINRLHRLLMTFFHRLDELGELDDDGKLKPHA